MKTTCQERTRIAENLAFIATRKPHTLSEIRWFAEVEAEARAAGLLPALVARIGSNCRPDIDRGIVYGGDMVDVF